jgi:threonine synthase
MTTNTIMSAPLCPQIPYNMERIWYLVSDMDTNLVSTLMRDFEKSLHLPLPPKLLNQVRQTIVASCVVPDEDIKKCLKKVWDDDAYLMCPHTATGVHLYLNHSSLTPHKSVLIATASVMKFEQALSVAGVEFPDFDVVSQLMKMEGRCLKMVKGKNWEKILRGKIEEISQNILNR